MKIDLHIYCDQNKIYTQLEVVRNFLPTMKKAGIKYTFDLSELSTSEHENKEKIQKIIDTKSFQRGCEKLMKEWDKRSDSIIQAIQKIISSNIAPNDPIVFFNCYCIPFGCSGYFNTPNEIFINVLLNNTEFQIQTIIHEFFHLVYQTHTSGLEYSAREKFVDDLFNELPLKKEFPNYEAQNFNINK